jgi:hypothetical protein
VAEKSRPDVTGKAPAICREMLDIFKEIEGSLGNLSEEAAEKVKSVLDEKYVSLEPVLSRAYVKTVKAGETAWDCKEMALELKQTADSGDNDKALDILGRLETELDGFYNKIKTFVVRMT